MPAPVIKLSVPISTPERDGVTDLVFKRRMNAGDLAACGFSPDLAGIAKSTTEEEAGAALSKLTAAQVNLIVSRCCDLPLVFIESIDASDWGQCWVTVLGFFGSSPASGGQGSPSSPVSTTGPQAS